ncbi:MAG TPA: SDR family oxidoreductase [Roseateles sp.]|nr:SDR family oxidoreductase [Roseateles sp.]
MKVVVITGASDGIGAELARQWAQRDGPALNLVLAARSLDKLAGVAAQCQALGAQVLALRCDVAIQADCRALIDAAIARFGHLDVLVNNAGISAHALLSEVRAEDLGWYEGLMRVNFWGSVWTTHAALPHLKASEGRIVAVSSLAGLVGVPGRTAYSASKFAMSGFFEALRAELAGDRVSVTLAYPGVVATQIRHHGLNARGQPLGRSSLDESGAMTVQTCARLILEGTQGRRREIVMTAKGRLGRWLKLLTPGLVDRLALRALAKEELPR